MEAAELAGRIGDGLIGTAPEEAIVDTFAEAGGAGKPRYAQATVCWAESEEDARRTALEWWPNAALRGPLSQELPLPSHFEEAAAMVTEDDVAQVVACGPDVDSHLELIDEVREGRVHARLRPPGRPRPGRVPRLLLERDPAAVLERDRRRVTPRAQDPGAVTLDAMVL